MKEAFSRGWNRFFIRVFESLIFGAFFDSRAKFSFLSGFGHVKIRFFIRIRIRSKIFGTMTESG